MKLLFEYNLSPRLVLIFADLYPDSQHVFPLQMDQDDDRLIWDYVLQNDYTIVTRDSDYNDLSFNSSSPALYRFGERREECARIKDSTRLQSNNHRSWQ
jgi:predicted nuclease of predicted toxin-antitoxin system